MGSAERRTRERVETRQRILDAARDMFVRHGYEATTMRAIADRIEYTPTAIYHHFKNKQELLTELCSIDLRALAGAFQKVVRIEDPVERLRRVGEAYVAFALERPMQYQLLFMTRRPDGGVSPDVARGDPTQDAYAFLLRTCTDVVESGRLRPEYGDPEEVAQICWSSLHGLIALHIVKRDDQLVNWRDARTTASRMGAAMIRGMLKKPKD